LAHLIDVQIIADTPALRAGLTALLNDPRLRALGGLAVADPPDALSPRTHVIADDARLITLARDISQGGGNEAVVALTELAAAATEFSTLNLRGWAVLPPGADGEDLVMAVILASRGHVLLPAIDAAGLFRPDTEPGIRTFEPLRDPLTPREQEVLDLIATGATDKVIAEKLSLSLHTVKSHVRNILSKTHAVNRRHAAKLTTRK
jgi:DNA-binding NarL/FixJ family response regulator